MRDDYVNFYKDRCLEVLKMSVRSLTTKEVAKYASVDWATADKYLKEFFKDNKISDRLLGNRVHQWRFIK